MTPTFESQLDIGWLETQHPGVARKVHKLHDFKQDGLNSSSLRFVAEQQVREAYDAAKTNHGRAVEAMRAGAATESDVARMEADMRRARERLDRTQAESTAILQASAGDRTVADNCLALVNSPRPSGAKRVDIVVAGERGEPYHGKPRVKEGEPSAKSKIQVVPVELPTGDPDEIAARQAGIIGDLKAELDNLERAVPRKDSVAKRLSGLVQELANRGAPRLEGAGVPDGRLGVAGPRVIIHAAPARSGPGWKPTADDGLALAAWLNPDRVLAKLKSDLETAYRHAPLELDPHEKQRRRRELAAEILAAERLEAEAIWRMINGGDDKARFRPDMNPRAILGIA